MENDNCHVEPLDKPLDEAALATAMAAYLVVGGMGCPRCAQRVRNGLLSLDGVLLADVFLERSLAAAAYDPQVDRPDDRRQTELTVREGEIVEATVKYWDFREKRWLEPSDLNQEQASPFTVPGLFEMVQGELRSSGRADVRVVMDDEPAFPHRIVLGPVWQDLRPVEGTEATVTVREFKALQESE